MINNLVMKIRDNVFYDHVYYITYMWEMKHCMLKSYAAWDEQILEKCRK